MTTTNETLIVIPARYNSKRLPGKPLLMLAGKSMLQRVCETARLAAEQSKNVNILVATDDERILQHAESIGVSAVMTPSNCETGTDRIIAAIAQLKTKPQAIINLQGDAPLTPVIILKNMLAELNKHSSKTVVTPIIQLSWQELAFLRKTKQSSPFSGTTVIVNSAGQALWFSKNIIPAMREEEKLSISKEASPVHQHIGIYGYTMDMLETFSKLPVGFYEQLEGLEQLRYLENGYSVQTVKVDLPNLNTWRGVDTIEDAQLVEKLLGELN
jgi:3-deoxy-manno-octulosonate cytidylyltransferase (CMP-KDO synthetase)